MLDVSKYPPSAHGFTCRNCGGGDRGRVAIYRPFGEVSLSLNRTVTCMVLKANDRRTSCPCHDEFRGPRSDYVRQVTLFNYIRAFGDEPHKFEPWLNDEGPHLSSHPLSLLANYTNGRTFELSTDLKGITPLHGEYFVYRPRTRDKSATIRFLDHKATLAFPLPSKTRLKSCQVIYSQFGLAIHQNDHQARRRFVEWAQNEIVVVPDFHKRILFSDEAHFWLKGYVNKQNCRISSEANPQVYVETPLHPEKLTV
ncbi:uncharacterized protein TNCV_1596981 [Trichonephila clavipes]|nr:uncharacterized protein TNCV_1596981 [Trichonephila clavipes]